MKKIIAFLLTVLLLTPTVSAYTDQQVNTADALNHLGLFLGTGVDYELDGKLTRAQGITLLVRMIGMETKANSISYTAPFTDVPEWAAGYVNYAWMHKITNGISDTEFDPDAAMTDYMFLTLVLRVLGYKDSGNNPEFQWDDPYALAKSVGLISTVTPDDSFRRGDAITVFWNALLLNDRALAKDLIESAVFSADEFAKAVDIYEHGRGDDAGIPVLPSDPVVPDTPGSDYDDTDDDDDFWYPPFIPDDSDSDPDPVPPSSDPDEPDTPTSPEQPNDPDDSGSSDVPPADVSTTYEEYMNMTDAQKQAFMDSFSSRADYFDWKDAAEEEYKNGGNYVEIGGNSSVDLGDLVNGNN